MCYPFGHTRLDYEFTTWNQIDRNLISQSHFIQYIYTSSFPTCLTLGNVNPVKIVKYIEMLSITGISVKKNFTLRLFFRKHTVHLSFYRYTWSYLCSVPRENDNSPQNSKLISAIGYLDIHVFLSSIPIFGEFWSLLVVTGKAHERTVNLRCTWTAQYTSCVSSSNYPTFHCAKLSCRLHLRYKLKSMCASFTAIFYVFVNVQTRQWCIEGVLSIIVVGSSLFGPIFSFGRNRAMLQSSTNLPWVWRKLNVFIRNVYILKFDHWLTVTWTNISFGRSRAMLQTLQIYHEFEEN